MYRNLENKDTIILNKVNSIYVIIEYTKVPIDIFKPIRDLIKIGLYKDEQEALRDLVHEKANLKTFPYHIHVQNSNRPIDSPEVFIIDVLLEIRDILKYKVT